MKKLVLILVILSLFTIETGAKWDRQILGPDVVIESLTLNPYPVGPGGTFDLTMKVRNSNTQRTINFPKFTIQESYPFTIETNPKTQMLNSLIPNEETLVNFRVRIDENAITGVNNLRIIYQEGAGLSHISEPIKIDVKSSGVELSIASIKTLPEEIYPGDQAQLKLILTNTLPVLMKNIELDLDFSSVVTPFTPLGTTTQRTLTALNKGGSIELLFDIMVDANAEPKVYKIPLSIGYLDEFGNEYTVETLTGIKVSTSPKILINVEKSEVTQALTPGNVVIKVSNLGLADIKFLTVKLQPSKDYEILSAQQTYIGNLESDDYETAEFKIMAKSYKKEVPLKLLLTYKDSFNKELELQEEIFLINYSGMRLASFGLGGVFKLIFYIILISFVYVTLLEWRKTKHLQVAIKKAILTILVRIKRIIKGIRFKSLKGGVKAFVKFMKEP